MFVLGSLWGRHLLVLTNLRLALWGQWVGGRGSGGGWDGVKEWQWATGYDNGDIFGGKSKWAGWSVESIGGFDFLCGRRMICGGLELRWLTGGISCSFHF